MRLVVTPRDSRTPNLEPTPIQLPAAVFVRTLMFLILTVRILTIWPMSKCDGAAGDPQTAPASRLTPRHPIALARRFYQIATAVTAEVHEHEETGLRHLEFGVMFASTTRRASIRTRSRNGWRSIGRRSVRWSSGSNSRD